MKRTDKRGFVLVFVMLAIIIAIYASVFYATVTTNFSIAKKSEVSQRVYYLAQAGIEYCVYIIENQPTTDPNTQSTWPTGGNTLNGFGGQVTVTITPNGSNWTAASTASDSGKTVALNAEVSSTGQITKWN
jgi:type II secretory pathway component PulK